MAKTSLAKGCARAGQDGESLSLLHYLSVFLSPSSGRTADQAAEL